MSGLARRCEDAIRRVGGEAALLRDGLRLPFPASVQPRLSAEEPEGSPHGVGYAARMTLFTPLGEDVYPGAGDTVEYAGLRYRVLRCEDFFFQGKPIYRWAVLRRETGKGDGTG